MDDGNSGSRPKGTLFPQLTVFDGWRSISIALYMSLIGYAVVVGIPVISTAWVTLLGFSEVEVGRVAGADLGGLSLGSLLTSLLINRMNRRLISLVGIIMAVTANGLCMVYLDYEHTLWLRGLAGIGSGVVVSIALATLGGTSRPALAFNFMLFAFAFTQAGELQILPQLSMNGIYILFISLFLINILFLPWVPEKAALKDTEVDINNVEKKDKYFHLRAQMPFYIPWVCLSAIFFTYVSIGAYWTYIQLAGANAGIDDTFNNQVLVWASFMSLVGCLVATLISDRIGLARPLILALTAVAWSVSQMVGDVSIANFLASVFVFNFLWIFVDVYQMGSMANFDPAGKYVSLIPGAQGVGQIVGPNLAATLLSYELGYDAVFIMCGTASIIGMLIYALIYFRLRRIVPALADAS